MALQVREIEFVGGPFDGYVHNVQAVSAELPSIITLPVNRQVVGQGTVFHARESIRPTSLAYYELIGCEGSPRYRFLGAARAPRPAAPGFLPRLKSMFARLGRCFRRAERAHAARSE